MVLEARSNVENNLNAQSAAEITSWPHLRKKRPVKKRHGASSREAIIAAQARPSDDRKLDWRTLWLRLERDDTVDTVKHDIGAMTGTPARHSCLIDDDGCAVAGLCRARNRETLHTFHERGSRGVGPPRR
jgi:hypothetical protein